MRLVSGPTTQLLTKTSVCGQRVCMLSYICFPLHTPELTEVEPRILTWAQEVVPVSCGAGCHAGERRPCANYCSLTEG